MKHLRVPVVASLVTLALAVGCGTPEPLTPADVPPVDAATATDASQVSDTAMTNAPRSAFADGLSTHGNVGVPAIGSLARIEAATSDHGITLTPQSDGSVLPSGNASSTTNTVRFTTSLRALTGIRLKALETPGLPTHGPGASSRGNFSLSECRVAVGPVPSSCPRAACVARRPHP